jgi:pSer/pThr/pTyr-binding forkhead associated (FHA) protein
MIHLEIGGERYAIAAGETAIGSASDNRVVLAGEGVQPRHAVVQASQPGSAAIRAAAAEAEVRVNGVKLGAAPTPLLHGDKIAIGSHELRVVDSTRGGSTQLFDSGAFADLLPPKSSKPPAGTTGGRLVCLTDGREYTVGENPLRLGRDAASDVVVTGHDVSREHAEIRADPQGYMLVDLSVNGTYVNGERIGKTHLLARADVIRIGNDEFRFYADAAARLSGPAPEASGGQTVEPPAGASQRLSDTMHGFPVISSSPDQARSATPPSPIAAPLASFLFRSGELRGKRLPIKVPVVNIGRGDYNDVVIADPSVSTMHAKLQRRDAIWILTDLGSTNGTFVEGERLTGEAPLGPGATLRFGDVSVLFEPLDDSVPAPRTGSTRLIPRVEAEDAPPTAPALQPKVASAPEAPSEPLAEAPRPRPRRPIHVAPPRPKRPSTITVVGLLILVAILAYLLSTT